MNIIQPTLFREGTLLKTSFKLAIMFSAAVILAIVSQQLSHGTSLCKEREWFNHLTDRCQECRVCPEKFLEMAPCIEFQDAMCVDLKIANSIKDGSSNHQWHEMEGEDDNEYVFQKSADVQLKRKIQLKFDEIEDMWSQVILVVLCLSFISVAVFAVMMVLKCSGRFSSRDNSCKKMVHVIKVHLDDANGEKQIRRLAVSSDVASSYRLLKEKIQSLFQLDNNNFSMKWKDSDNDFIVMSSDEELAHALANAEDGLLRVFLFRKQGVDSKPKTPEAPTGDQTNGDGVRHRLVTCDGCDKDIFGPRYKCLQCENFDLCSVCNSANKHSEHDMIKLVKPSDVPREWVFWGSGKLWRSLFGICPGRFFRNHQPGQASSSPSSDSGEGSAKTSPQGPHKRCHGSRPHGFPGEAFFNAMGQEFGDAQKIFTDVVQNLANLVPGVEVEVRRDPPNAGCKANEHNTGAKQPATSDDTSHINADENVTQPKERDTAQPAPKKENPMPFPMQSEKEETTEIPVQPKSDEVKSFPVSSVETKVANNAAAKPSESREQSPIANMDTSMNVDDWTLIHDEESTIPEVATAVEAPTQAPVDTTQEVHYPKLEEIGKKSEDGNVIQTSDPKIINALIKMHAMGFTNEGGWLERLLITKHGNINEALDALYPFSQRH